MTDTQSAVERYLDTVRQLGFHDRQQYGREAFSRNLGLISEWEQEQLSRATVAIPGVGGVGGLHLITLVRAGIGRFHVADLDVFEAGNVNRQYGARVPDFGRPKLGTMVDEALSINPFLEIETFPEGVTRDNAGRFLQGVDVVLDSLDFFAFDTRRMLCKLAREKGIYVVSAGPIGFSAALLIFAPDAGMTFDEYFDVDENTGDLDKIVAFLVGLTPRTKYLSYMDVERANRTTGRGPSLGLACQLCSGVAATEALRIVLHRNLPRPVPHFAQFDPYLRRYYRGRLRWGNRHPWQRVKRRLVRRMFLAADRKEDRLPPRAVDSTGEETPTDEALRYIAEAAIQAPSGDNAQPWRLAIRPNGIDVFLDSAADRSFFNVQQTASLISCGAVVENIFVAAEGCGLAATVDGFPDRANPDHVAAVEFHRAGSSRTGLHEAIWRRHTNRTMFRSLSLGDGVIKELDELTSAFPGVRLHFMLDPRELKRLARLVRRADLLRVSHRGLHEHFHDMVRRTAEEAAERRDGFPIENLEAGAVGELFLKWTRRWPVMRTLNAVGLGRMFAAAAARGLHHCSGAALLTVPGTSREDFVTGGRALERVWLRITDLGLAMQPMTAVTLFWLRCQLEGEGGFEPRHRVLLDSLWPEYRSLFPRVDFERDGQIMLFRFGHGRRMSVETQRKRLEDLVVSNGELGSSG